MDNRFVNLHGHSEYSSLDGFCKISSLVSRVQAIGQQAIALTDHGNLNGAYKFYKECTKHKIKPILGNEMYLTRTYEKGGQKYYHATILAQNNAGWSNLLKLHKLSYINRYYKPRVDFNDLFAHKEGLIVLSGCPSGVLSSHIRDNDLKSAENNLLLFKEQFGDNFYIEIMDHSLEFQKNINKALRELSAKYNIKKVATVDYHYPEKSDALYQDYLVCDQLKTDINDTTRKMKLEPSEFYIKRREEVNATEDELDNTLEIADKCSVKIQSTGWLLPHIENEQELLVQYIEEGFIKRNIPRNDIYLSRLREEYKTVIEANLVGYLLTVRDYINFARENDILVGPGRGSVGGCLIAYLIGIHDVNPIKHNLLFSRFYNAGRSHSLPDIDIDFPEKDIQTVRDYIHNKYGKEYVAHIGTSTVLQPKGAVKLLCRVLGIEFKQSNIYSETVEDTNASLKLAARDSVYADIIEKAKHFEGLSVYSSIHAAGMIISPEKLENLIPLRVNEENDLYVSGWDMKDVEGIGLVKFDFLSLNTLDVIKDTLKSVNLKIEDIPTDDQKAFELINTTNNVGIFQLSSDGISKLANDAKVQSIDDIAAVVALYRPGPMGSNFHIKYVNRKHGKEPVTYLHPKLEPVLKNTYGLLIFQEQTTQIAMALAGFTEREADNLRKAVGKKIVDLMQEQKELFLKGCEKNDIPKAIASEIWHEIEMFAGYGFNLSHSVEYGYITYYTAYLKAHYPLHFMASLLNNNYNKADKLRLYLIECYKMGIKVNPPSVKNGNYDFRVYQNEIIFGLKGVNGIGDKTAKTIYACAFENFEDFCIKIKPSKDLIVILAEAGALDDFGYTRNTFIESAPEIVDKLKGRKVNPKTRSLFESKTNVFIKQLPELEDNVLANKEYSRLNTYLRYDPLKNVELAVPEALNGLIFIEGFISKFESKITKKKSTIGIIKLATKLGPIEVIIFPKLYVEIKEKIKENMYIAVEGNYEDKLLARKIWPRYE